MYLSTQAVPGAGLRLEPVPAVFIPASTVHRAGPSSKLPSRAYRDGWLGFSISRAVGRKELRIDHKIHELATLALHFLLLRSFVPYPCTALHILIALPGVLLPLPWYLLGRYSSASSSSSSRLQVYFPPR